MSLLQRIMKEDLVYWPPGLPGQPIATDDTGVPVFVAPVALRARWENRQVVRQDPTGQNYTTKALIYVSQAVAPQGFLWRGTLGDPDQPTDPNSDPRCVQIIEYDETPWIDYNPVKTLREAYV